MNWCKPHTLEQFLYSLAMVTRTCLFKTPVQLFFPFTNLHLIYNIQLDLEFIVGHVETFLALQLAQYKLL